MRKIVEGVIEYRTDGIGVEGRETYQLLGLPTGGRLLRAQSEMENDRLLRDTLLTVDAAFRPLTAQMHLIVGDAYVGAGQYHFEPDRVRFEGHTAAGGYTSQVVQLDRPVPAFAGHAVQNDAWLYAALEQAAPDGGGECLDGVVLSSRLPNGGDGPALEFSDQRHRFVADETIETPAGRFAVRHYEFLLADRPSIHYWVTTGDYLLIRARWDLLEQTYELVELNRPATEERDGR